MKYIKYFESVNSQSVVDLLSSYGFYSEEEIISVLEDSLSDLKDIIQYFNDESDKPFITLISGGTSYLQFFNKYNKERKSNIVLNNQVVRVDLRFSNKLKYKNTSDITYKDILDRLNIDFKVVYQHLEHPYYYLHVNLVPENVVYYEIYKYSAGKMKSGDYYKIKPLYPLFKDSFEESLNYSQELIKDFSVKLHHLRAMYNVGFSIDGKEIDIRILPE